MAALTQILKICSVTAAQLYRVCIFMRTSIINFLTHVFCNTNQRFPLNAEEINFIFQQVPFVSSNSEKSLFQWAIQKTEISQIYLLLVSPVFLHK